MGRYVIFATFLATGIAGTYFCQETVDASIDRTPRVELRYLLQAENLRRVSCGYPQVVADLLWIKSIEFYHQQFLDRLLSNKEGTAESDYKWLREVSDLVTDLNPKFVHAYWHFSLYMGGTEHGSRGRFEDEESIATKLLVKGYENNSETCFLSDALAFSYLQYYRRLTEQDPGSEYLAPERQQELLARYRERCLFYADRAAAAPDATDLVRWSVSNYRQVLGGDQCVARDLLVTLYDERYTQDIERQQAIYPLVQTIDRCNVQTLTTLAAERGISLEPGTARDLARLLDRPLPRNPWRYLAKWLETGRPMPEKLTELLERQELPPHPFDYFVAVAPDGVGRVILSSHDGERREGSLLSRATEASEAWSAQFGFMLRDPREAARLLGQTIYADPFDRRFVYDPISKTALAEVDSAFVQHVLVPEFDAAKPENRFEHLQYLVRMVDGATARQLKEQVGPAWSMLAPGEAPSLSRLLGQRPPPSPWSLLDRYEKTPPGEIPATARELMGSLAPGEEEDYVITPTGDVMARPVALALRQSHLDFLEKRLAEYWEKYNAAPAAVPDLYPWLPISLPPDPLGARYELDGEGKHVLVLER